MFKRLLLLSIFCLIAFPVFATDYTADSACQVAYLFTEGSGTTVDNAEGTAAYDGTFKADGQPAWYNATLPAVYTTWSADFDGSDDFISVGDVDIANDITIVAWIKTDYIGTDYRTIIAKRNGTTVNYGFDKPNSAEGSDEIRFFYNDGNWHIWNSTSLDLDTNNWFHVAVTYDETNDAIFYGDGSSGIGSTRSLGTAGGTLTVNNEVCYLGTYTGGGASEWWDGKMTEVAIFDRVLTSTEINDIMDNGLVGTVSEQVANGSLFIMF